MNARLEQQRSIAKAKTLKASWQPDPFFQSSNVGWQRGESRPSPCFQRLRRPKCLRNAFIEVVHAQCPKGLARAPGVRALEPKVMALEGDEKPKGMLDMNDISRKASENALGPT